MQTISGCENFRLGTQEQVFCTQYVDFLWLVQKLDNRGENVLLLKEWVKTAQS